MILLEKLQVMICIVWVVGLFYGVYILDGKGLVRMSELDMTTSQGFRFGWYIDIK